MRRTAPHIAALALLFAATFVANSAPAAALAFSVIALRRTHIQSIPYPSRFPLNLVAFGFMIM